jgi:hypothetical protein
MQRWGRDRYALDQMCRSAEIHRCSDADVHRCTGAEMKRCRGSDVQRGCRDDDKMQRHSG